MSTSTDAPSASEAALRARWIETRDRTHYDGCALQDARCALAVVFALLDTTRADLARMTAEHEAAHEVLDGAGIPREDTETAPVLTELGRTLTLQWRAEKLRADLATAREEITRLLAGDSLARQAMRQSTKDHSCGICGTPTQYFSSDPSKAPSFHMKEGAWRPFHMTCVGRAIDLATPGAVAGLGEVYGARQQVLNTAIRLNEAREALTAAEAERDALRAWKAEAMAVLTEHDDLARGYVTEFGLRELGQSVVRLVVEDARALRTQLTAATGEIEQPGGWREMVRVANAKIGELEQQLAALRTERGR